MDNQHDDTFNPKVCNQIHKRVGEKYSSLFYRVDEVKDDLIERIKSCKENVLGQLEHKDALIKKEIQLTLGSIKTGVDKLTEAINAHAERIQHNDDRLDEIPDDAKEQLKDLDSRLDKIPDDTKKQLQDLQDWKSKYNGGAKIAAIVFVLIQTLFLLYHNYYMGEVLRALEEAKKLTGG